MSDLFDNVPPEYMTEAMQPGLLPEVLSKFLATRQNDTWVCGGALRSIYMGDTPKDFDVFFKDCHAAAALGIHLENNGYPIVDGKQNSVIHRSSDGITIELVHSRYWESLEAVLDSFDFTVVMAGTDGSTYVKYQYFEFDNDEHKLMIHNPTYPNSTVWRIAKYANKGYTISAEQVGKFMDKYYILKDGYKGDILLGSGA